MKYQQLTLEERVLISYLVNQGLNLSEIARQMGRHRSTISRELRRNRCHGIDRYYRYSRATHGCPATTIPAQPALLRAGLRTGA